MPEINRSINTEITFLEQKHFHISIERKEKKLEKKACFEMKSPETKHYKPSQTRQWTRLKPTVMLVDNKKTIFGRNRGIPKTRWVIAWTKRKSLQEFYTSYVCIHNGPVTLVIKKELLKLRQYNTTL